MTPQAAFKMFWGISLHFGSMDYSVLKYGTNTKAAQAKFDSMSKEQRYRFEWLATKFVDTQDLVYACIGCQFDDVNIQYGNKEDIMDAYFKFKARREAMSYNIKSDQTKHELLGFIPTNKLIFKYFVGEISPEYIILLCNETDELLDLYSSPNFSWAKDKILKLIKYISFFNSSKYLHLIENHENHVAH